MVLSHRREELVDMMRSGWQPFANPLGEPPFTTPSKDDVSAILLGCNRGSDVDHKILFTNGSLFHEHGPGLMAQGRMIYPIPHLENPLEHICICKSDLASLASNEA